MKEEMRESYLALKKIAKEEFFRPLRAVVQHAMQKHNELLAKHDEPATGSTVKDEMRESYFEIKKVADDVIGKPARVLKEMIVSPRADKNSVIAKYDPAPAGGVSSVKDGGDKCPPGTSSGITP
jgi:hypothetical protein